jgi:murein DD-endopeptidase MepM/ murein hydrolase activator NlpD
VIRALTAILAVVLLLTACGDDDDSPGATLTASPSSAPTTGAAVSPTPAPTNGPAPTEPQRHPEPIGFPLGQNTKLGVVTGEVGSRRLIFPDDGPSAFLYARDSQAGADADAANASGWNCRTHVEYEGIAAVDFYAPDGTPVLSTMDGTVTIYAISVRNDFDRYGVDREPYLGNPDRSRAPVTPFPGPSSGLGVYAEVVNEGFVLEYGHLDLRLTANMAPAEAFLEGYSPESEWETLFAEVPEPGAPTAIAQWPVTAGTTIGATGDAGYSEGPHLHYTVRRTNGERLCPTNEAGFADGAWLFR